MYEENFGYVVAHKVGASDVADLNDGATLAPRRSFLQQNSLGANLVP